MPELRFQRPKLCFQMPELRFQMPELLFQKTELRFFGAWSPAICKLQAKRASLDHAGLTENFFGYLQKTKYTGMLYYFTLSNARRFYSSWGERWRLMG